MPGPAGQRVRHFLPRSGGDDQPSSSPNAWIGQQASPPLQWQDAAPPLGRLLTCCWRSTLTQARQVRARVILPSPTMARHAKFARVHMQAVLNKLRSR